MSGAGAGAGAGAGTETAAAAPAVDTEMPDVSDVKDLFAGAIKVLSTPNADTKAKLASALALRFASGDLTAPSAAPTEIPAIARPPAVKEDADFDKCRSGSRRFAAHALVHHYSCSIDMAFDTILRFAASNAGMKDLCRDMMTIAANAAKNYLLWQHVLSSTFKSLYGSCPGEKLTAVADANNGSLSDRIGAVYVAQLSNSLDWSKVYLERFQRGEANDAAELLKKTQVDDVNALALGVKYFSEINGDAAEKAFHTILAAMYTKAQLMPYFDEAARKQAKLPKTWYAPLQPADTDAFGGLLTAEAAANWEAGANATDPFSDAALSYVVERLTNKRFPMHLLQRIVKLLPA